MKTQKERLSVFLSLVLRHHPEAAGITLDEHGWADVPELLRGVAATGRSVNKTLLEDIVATDAKGRYAFNPDHTLIRANQGHSIPVDVELPEAVPPECLYHGTATRFLDSILAKGLCRQSRLYVHLSQDVGTAEAVGARHGKSIVLRVRAQVMYQDGCTFFLSRNGVWLCEAVPVEYLEPVK